MPEKARQHLIPRVFLKSFCDPEPPANHPLGKPFAPGVWVLDKELSQAPYRKSPANLFAKLHPYTLAADKPGDPVIERWLSQLENAFEHTRKKLLNSVDLSRREWSELLRFIGVLHARTRDQIDRWQASMTELEKMTRMVERGHTGKEDYSDSEFIGWNEIGKRSIQDRAEAFVKAMLSGSIFLVENEIGIPFVSSDTPVALSHLYPNWLRQQMIFPHLIPKDVNENKRAFIAFCALSPTLGLLASPMLGRAGRLEHLRVGAPGPIFALNWFMLTSADAVLLSHQEKPFPDYLAEGIRKSLRSSRRLDHLDSFMSLTTNSTTYKIEAVDLTVEHVGIDSTFRFRTRDIETLRSAASCDAFIEAYFRTPGGASYGSIRNARFSQVATDAEGISVVHQFFCGC